MENSNWQTQLSTVRERNEYAFNKSLFCDVEFSVVDSNGDKVTIPANKYVLAISSPVFEAMFYGKLAETGTIIDLPDCTKEGLQEMLRFVYSEEVDLTGSNAMDVLYIAEKYMMPFLEEKCHDFLGKNLSPQEAFSVLAQAKESCNTKVEVLCWNVVDFETYEAVTSEAFLNISHELLKQVLGRETLHTDEVNLFKAVDRWASNKIQDESLKFDGSAKRAILGDELVRLIRFPVMSQKEFAENVLVSEILHGSEVTEIVQVFSSVAPSQTSFGCTKRMGQWSERWSENRFTAIDSRHSKSDNHVMVFEVNKPIFLAGVRVFFGEAYSTKANVSLSIQVKNCKYYLFQTKFSCDSKKAQRIDNSYSGYTILIDPPILLVPEKVYTVRASIPRKLASQGSGGKKVIRCDDIEITLSNSENSATTVDCGQFPSFLLKRKILLSNAFQVLDPPVSTSFSSIPNVGFSAASASSTHTPFIFGLSPICVSDSD